jgi:O-antigen/teichoic acid export membrane protein
MRQQLRQLSGDTAIYGMTTIAQRFLTFLLTPFYTQYLVPADLGIQTNIFSIIAFVMVIANAGMEAAYFKFYSVAADDDEKRRVYWNAIIMSWLAAAAIGGMIVASPALFDRVALLNLSPGYYGLLRMAGGIIFLDAASTVTLASLRMTRRPKVFSAIKIASIVINVGLNLWLVAGLRMGLEGILIANLVQSAIQFLLLIPFLVRQFPVATSRSVRAQMLRFGPPTVVAGLSAIALQVVDRPIMQNISGFQALGVYQANYRLGIVMMMFVSMFEFAWRPFFLQQASKPNARQLYARVFTYFNLLAAVIFLLFGFYMVNIAAIPLPFRSARTVIHPQYWRGLVIVPIILSSYIFNGWYTNFIAGVYIEKKTQALAWITAIAAAASVLLCFLLIPPFEIVGGAWATWLSYLLMALVLYFYVQRYYRIEYEWGRVARIAIGVVGIWAANTLLLDFNDRSLHAAMIRLGLLALFPVWLFASGFFHKEEQREFSRLVARFRLRGGGNAKV